MSSPLKSISKQSKILIHIDNIVTAQESPCSCVKGEWTQSCPSRFETWEILKLRTQRLSVRLKEQIQSRNRVILSGYDNLNLHHRCRPTLLHRQVCLKGYCIVMGWNYNSVCNGLKALRSRDQYSVVPIGKPTARFRRKAIITEECKSWIMGWVHVTADHDPTGEQYCYSINFVHLGNLHKIYSRETRTSDFLQTTAVASERTFRRQFKAVCEEERVRIRKKIHTSTKCKGVWIVLYSIVLLMIN